MKGKLHFFICKKAVCILQPARHMGVVVIPSTWWYEAHKLNGKSDILYQFSVGSLCFILVGIMIENRQYL